MSEIVEILDDKNNVIGKATRKDAVARNLKHKSAFVLLQNTKGQFNISKRAPYKKVFPNLWAVGSGGAVDLGEEWEQAAKRELKEELDIDATVTFLFDFNWDDDHNRYWAKIYHAVSDDPVTINEGATEDRWAAQEEIEMMIKTGKMCPDTAEIMQRFF